MTSIHSAATQRPAWTVLAYPEFRLLYIAQFLTQTGSSMQVATVDWHIYGLTNSEFALGLVGLVRVIPILLLSLFGGVISDAVDRRRLMLTTQPLMALTVGVLAISALSGGATPALLYLVTAIIAGIVAFESPARFALLASSVPQDRVADAGRVNVVLYTVTPVLGALLGSWILKSYGPGMAYLGFAIALVGSFFVLRMVRVAPPPPHEKRAISAEAFREGVRFIFSNPPLWGSMILDFVATFFSSALALLPVYAKKILITNLGGWTLLQEPEFRYGLLRSAPFVGAALGAIYMAQYGGRIKRQGETMLLAVGFYGVATVVFGFSDAFWLSLAALAMTGFMDSVSAGVRSAMRQVLTPDRLRGRMQSVMMIFFLGGPQLGEFEAGALAAITSVRFSVVSGGVLTVIAVAALAVAVPALRAYREIPTPTIEQEAQANEEQSEALQGKTV